MKILLLLSSKTLSLKIFNFSLLRNRQEIHITLSMFSFSLFFFIWCIACVPKNGPEGGRSSTPDILPTGKKMARDPSASAPQHRSFPLYYSNDDRRFFTHPRHQTHVAFSNTSDMVSSLCWAHLLTFTLVLVFFPLHIYMESLVGLCSVLWGVSVHLFERAVKQGQRGTWWLEHHQDGYS